MSAVWILIVGGGEAAETVWEIYVAFGEGESEMITLFKTCLGGFKMGASCLQMYLIEDSQ